MARHITRDFQTIHSEGGLLPPDLLRRVVDPNGGIPGITPQDYDIQGSNRLNESISRSWTRLCRLWKEFRDAANELRERESGTGLTNDKWSLPLLRELGFGSLPSRPGPEINGRSYAINRFFRAVPVHLVGCGLSLDRRVAGVPGAAKANPHGLVQEYLNRSDESLWAIVCNGVRLRILRDSQALSRQSYVEFDLESMFTGEVFSDFVILWLTVHATRFAPRDGGSPESCWLEQWTRLADEQGTRALESLREGVEKAVEVLGQGFIAHPRNTALREGLRSGSLTTTDFHSQLLRTIYRLIFLFAIEDREHHGSALLHPPDESEEGRYARARYEAHYSTARLRNLASRIKGSRHGDLWHQFSLLVGALSGEARFQSAREHLALPALGSLLWLPSSTSALNASTLALDEGTELANFDFLEALRHLAFIRHHKTMRPVDYRNLGSEELGSVYESLLELHPVLNLGNATFRLQSAGGHDRKTSGSYYTPTVLISSLLDTALEPVLERAAQGTDARKSILNIRVCDPSCGSGHFLVAAANRIAARLSLVQSGASESSPERFRSSLREVIGHCIYGVDINPMAVELCKVSLWLAALEPGRPLSFLNHHIQYGNSLIGATPALMAKGIPDDAFGSTTEDDASLCKLYKKRNGNFRRRRQESLFDDTGRVWGMPDEVTARIAAVSLAADDTLDNLNQKERQYHDVTCSSPYQSSRLIADAWCAAFLSRKTEDEAVSMLITQDVFSRLQRDPSACPETLRGQISRLAEKYKCFHWHLAFPEVFSCDPDNPTAKSETCGWFGGFDVILGNPPWDVHEVRDSEFFALSHPEIVAAKTAQQKKSLLKKVADDSPDIWNKYQERLAHAEKERHFISSSGRFGLSAVGSINLYKLFIENDHDVAAASGRVGLVIPSSFIADASSRKHFQKLHREGRIACVYDLENYEDYFSGTDRRFKFCLITILGAGGQHQVKTDFVFWARGMAELNDPNRHLKLSHEDLYDLNPLTASAPVTKSARDLELALQLQRKGVLLEEEGDNGWKIRARTMLSTEDSSSPQQTYEHLSQSGFILDSNCFKNGKRLFVPVYEGKMVGMYDHRSSSLIFNPANRVRKIQCNILSDSDHSDPVAFARPMFWVDTDRIRAKVGQLPRWSLAIKEITYVTNERTVIGSVLPPSGLANTLIWLDNPQSAMLNACLMANLGALVLDYVARQKVAGLHLRGHYIAQLPIVPMDTFQGAASFLEPNLPLCHWIARRVGELVCTAEDMRLFAEDCGLSQAVFAWNPERRFRIRCELDAAFFLLYGVSRVDAEYILDTFPTVRQRDEKAYGEYRTKGVIISIYDEMQQCVERGAVYQTKIAPPPGNPGSGQVTRAVTVQR